MKILEIKWFPKSEKKKKKNHRNIRLPNESNQLVRIARLLDHRTSKPTYGMMVLMPVRPDRNHIYFMYKTLYRGNREWAERLSKHYKIPIERLK